MVGLLLIMTRVFELILSVRMEHINWISGFSKAGRVNEGDDVGNVNATSIDSGCKSAVSLERSPQIGGVGDGGVVNNSDNVPGGVDANSNGDDMTCGIGSDGAIIPK